MNKICKIGIGAATLAGVATVSSAVAERFRKKWFVHGFEAGQFVGYISATENYSKANDEIIKAATDIADSAIMISRKYDKLCDDFAELERAYDELCAETDDE